MKRGSVFSEDVAFEDRLILDEGVLARKIAAMKELGLRIVLTSGSFDLPHIGHMRYLREARLRGDVLIVGIDSDAKVRDRKGRFRPIIPERERAEMVAHSRYADVVTIKTDGGEKWSLIKLIRPDLLIISERTGYDAETTKMLEQYCGEIVNLPSQATTSTSASVRQLQMETLRPFLGKLSAFVDEVRQFLGEDKS
jgi:D-beta-D-heptose 7-phosphate kinase/D-beta-D-heptose 1-phosphate adenosyltransferase